MWGLKKKTKKEWNLLKKLVKYFLEMFWVTDSFRITPTLV